MQQNNDQSLDKLVKKLMKDMAAETPSTDFTANLMMRVHTVKPGTAITYQPLISRQGWFMIVAGVLGLITYIIMNAGTAKPGWLNAVDYSEFYQRMAEGFSVIKFSMISLYAVALTTVLFFVQIRFLMNRYYKLLG